MGRLYYETYKDLQPRINIEHRCFYDIGVYNLPEEFHPTWIGTIRDPISRYASMYYYRSKPRTYRPGILHLVWTNVFYILRRFLTLVGISLVCRGMTFQFM